MPANTILVVDDRIQSLKGLIAILTDEGYEVLTAGDGLSALKVIEDHPTVEAILADLKMSGLNGLELYRRLAAAGTTPPFIIMTAYGTVKSAVEALKEGITDYLIKPLDYEELLIVLKKAIVNRRMSQELDALKRAVDEADSFHNIIGASPKMRQIYEMVRIVGPTDASVLIRGETGTGKELLARAIHLESRRLAAPQVSINCAALTESLLEGELFGYVKGAFTGAVSDKKGRLEAAHNGTLFLDEIGHMSLALQAKLLRFLQEMTFEPVGGHVSRQVDVRLITATNHDLTAEIRAGRFLADLLYRIEVITIKLPPLRERKDDLPLLANHFVQHYARKYDKPVSGIESSTMTYLVNYDWPGNIRELKNCLARAVILSKGQVIGPADLPEVIRILPPSAPLVDHPTLAGIFPDDGWKLKDLEMAIIRRTLETCAGNKSLAAKRLGISRKSLYHKLERYGLTSNGDEGE